MYGGQQYTSGGPLPNAKPLPEDDLLAYDFPSSSTRGLRYQAPLRTSLTIAPLPTFESKRFGQPSPSGANLQPVAAPQNEIVDLTQQSDWKQPIPPVVPNGTNLQAVAAPQDEVVDLKQQLAWNQPIPPPSSEGAIRAEMTQNILPSANSMGENLQAQMLNPRQLNKFGQDDVASLQDKHVVDLTDDDGAYARRLHVEQPHSELNVVHKGSFDSAMLPGTPTHVVSALTSDNLTQNNLQELQSLKKVTSSEATCMTSETRLKTATQERLKKFRLRLPEQCVGQSRLAKAPGEEVKMLLRGEVEFTGLGAHRAHYVIVHKEQEEIDEILRWMFIAPAGWRLKPPNLLLFGLGGRDHYVNWSSSSTLRNRKSWAVEKVSRDVKGSRPNSAKNERGDLPLPTHKQSKPRDESMFHKKFRSRLTEVAGGICQAVLECGGWFDFGEGSRGGLAEVLKDGLKFYWSAFGYMAGHKTDSVALAIRSLEDTEFGEQFLACAQPATPEYSLALESRVMYPSVDMVLFPELNDAAYVEDTLSDFEDGEEATRVGIKKWKESTSIGSAQSSAESNAKLALEVRFNISRRFLMNALTHVIFVQNQQVKDKLRLYLKDIATRAVICANGSPAFVRPGIEGRILTEAMAGVPIICLHHTGGAAEMLGHAVNVRRQVEVYNPDYDFVLPENISDEHILVLSPAIDSVEKVINKLTLVLSTVTDKEMMEVGYQKGERSRLRYAWELYTLFKYNSVGQRCRGRWLQYIFISIQVLLTFLALFFLIATSPDVFEGDEDFSSALHRTFKEYKNMFRALYVLFPILNAFVLTLISRFNPIGKWAHLESGAVMMKSEIYIYRCRVMHYSPRSSNVEEKIEALSHGEGTRKGKKEGQNTLVPSRRGAFASAVEAINSETVGSDLRGDSLGKPSAEALTEVLSSLYDSRSVRQTEPIRQRTCSCCCHHRRESTNWMKERLGHLAEEDQKEWLKAFSEFQANPYVIDDELLRDDGFALITAEDYMHFRFLPLLQGFNARSHSLSIKVHVVLSLQFFLSCLLAAAAAFDVIVFGPIIVSMIAAVASIEELEHFQACLRNVNQSLEVLKNLHYWWLSLSMVERRLPANKEILVSGTEATADAEISTWKKSLRPCTLTGAAKSEGDEEKEE